MATINFGNPLVTDFTLDESLGLQNGASSAGVTGDANDEDVTRATLAAASAGFSALLTTLGLDSFANTGRIALSSTDLYTISGAGNVTDIKLAGQYDAGTGTSATLANFTSAAPNFGTGGATGWTTTDGEAIYLFGDYNGMVAGTPLAGNVAFGIDASGDVAFVILMIEQPQADGTVDLRFAMVTAEAIQHPFAGDSTSGNHDEAINLGDFLSLNLTETSGFNFVGVPPGKSIQLTAQALSGDGGVIVTSLKQEVEINTSNAKPDGVIGFGSQGINAGESVAITWVKDGLVPDFTIPALDQNEADDPNTIRFANLLPVTQATVTVQQKVGNAVAAIKLTALNKGAVEDGDGTGPGATNFFSHIGNAAVGGLGDDVLVGITSVTLRRAGVDYTLNTDGTFGTTGVSADFVGSGTDASGHLNGQVILTNVMEGDRFTYSTGLAEHHRTVVTGVSGNVDIGGFSNTQSGSTAQPIGDAFVLEDSGPVVDVTVSTDVATAKADLSRNLDETIGTTDHYAAGEAQDNNSAADDTGSGPSWAVSPANAMGSLETDEGDLAALFGTSASFVSFDTDGDGSTNGSGDRTDTVEFVLTGTQPVQSTLVATAVVGSPLAAVDAAGRTVYLTLNADGTVLEGRTLSGDYLIVRMTLENASDPVNATITYEQFAPVQNPSNTLYDEPVQLRTVNVGESLSLAWTTTAYDRDGDSGTDTASVTLIDNGSSVFSIDDDGPVTGALPDDILLWEDGLSTGISDESEAEDVSASGNISSQIIAGSDGLKSIGFKDQAGPVASGLTAGGVAIFYHFTTGAGNDVLSARAGTTEIFTVTLGENGAYTVDLKAALDHAQGPAGQPEEDERVIDLTSFLYATEGDNDPAIIQNGAMRLIIEDDAVQISGLDDTPNALSFAATSSFTDTGFVNYGADGAGTLKISDWTQTLITNDFALGTVTGSLQQNGDLVYTSSEVGDIIRVSVDGTGSGSYTLQVLQDPPVIKIPLINGATTPGGPVEFFDLPPGGPTFVTFDGYLFTDPTADQQSRFDAGGDNNLLDIEDVNISQKGVGIKDNQIDVGEGLAMFFAEDVAGATFIIQGGTGAKGKGTIYVTGYDDDVQVGTTQAFDITLPKGAASIPIDFMAIDGVDEIYISHSFQAPNGFRIPEIYAFSFADIPDLAGTVTLSATDRDFDPAVDTFNFYIDGSDADTIA